jgi:hypothetical protein
MPSPRPKAASVGSPWQNCADMGLTGIVRLVIETAIQIGITVDFDPDPKASAIFGSRTLEQAY